MYKEINMFKENSKYFLYNTLTRGVVDEYEDLADAIHSRDYIYTGIPGVVYDIHTKAPITKEEEPKLMETLTHWVVIHKGKELCKVSKTKNTRENVKKQFNIE